MPRYPVSDHCDGERFFNIDRSADRSLRDVVRWMRTRERTAWPRSAASGGYPPPPASVAPGRVALTFIGHSTFLVRTASLTFITDPVFTSHAGPFGVLGPRRVRSPGLPFASLPPVDIVLVSHNHYDHLQHSSLRHFQRSASYVAPLGVGPYLGLRTSRIHELDWWQTVQIGGAAITAVPAQHFSARTPWDRNRTLWCGFVVEVDGLTIYFAGDTGYATHFAEAGGRWPRIDLALLPIGAYEPRWFMVYAHMNPEEAVRAHLDLHAGASVGMHFGTFQLTDEAIDEPLRALERARAERSVTADAFRVLGFGETAIV
ncbi:MAG TPA: MBL fold metallo-hydrolase [Vicinamibacterales bacterium]|nr:MBL fold metallo-hydrolase [Vicinamibacterales bacterium]